MIRSLQLLGAMTLCMTSLVVTSATPVSGAQLLDSCRAYRQEPRTGPGVFCAAYIRGFLAGASLHDRRLGTDAERRAGKGPEGAASDERRPYCIDESAPIDHIVVQLLEYATERSDADKLDASELLDATLRKMYECPRKLSN